MQVVILGHAVCLLLEVVEEEVYSEVAIFMRRALTGEKLNPKGHGSSDTSALVLPCCIVKLNPLYACSINQSSFKVTRVACNKTSLQLVDLFVPMTLEPRFKATRNILFSVIWEQELL